ncbi:hypothetical protein A2U01_0032976 [Trifolium medium]|uniref:Uncharacterized protein n=1 Tax=Trifolium medium TaxID=97028 RepID=A0A392PJ86_9FABA|nr:hypothetical protein [Trifolium medium]
MSPLPAIFRVLDIQTLVSQNLCPWALVVQRFTPELTERKDYKVTVVKSYGTIITQFAAVSNYKFQHAVQASPTVIFNESIPFAYR